MPGSGRSSGEGNGKLIPIFLPVEFIFFFFFLIFFFFFFFWPGEFHGQRSLECYSPWVAKSQIGLSHTHTHTHTLKERIPANHLTYSTIARDEICVSTHTLSTDKIHMLKLNLQ